MPNQPPFKFVQISDVHLDCKLKGDELWLPPSKQRSWNDECLDTLIRAAEVAKEHECDALIIAGNLWSNQTVSVSTVAKVVDLFASLNPMPVVIAPGREDFYFADSFYCQETIRAQLSKSWSQNVHIFTTPEFSIVRHPQRADVSFTGRALQSAETETTRPLSKGLLPQTREAVFNILVYSGVFDSLSQEQVDLPFSVGELYKQHFAYTALGGAWQYKEILAEDKTLLGAYPGSLNAHGLEESDARYAIIGKVESMSQRIFCELERLAMDSPRLVQVDVNVDGIPGEEISDRVREAVEQSKARKDQDLIFLRLSGTYIPDGEVHFLPPGLRESLYHIWIDNRARPNYLQEKADDKTTEGKFVSVMLDLKRKAESKGGILTGTTNGDLPTRLIEDALYYGLDALKQKKVNLRNAD